MSDTPTESDDGSSLIDLPARAVIRQVADPSHASGGGVIAGLTLAGAAASAELVLTLAARRKSLAAHRDEIENLLASVSAHRASFENAADRDTAAFSTLVDTQREAKRIRDSSPDTARSILQLAYLRAAQVPLDLSCEALSFMRDVEQSLVFASRFTVSDLGAAAALARGAIDAALLTVDANLAYVEDEQVGSLREQVDKIRFQAATISDRVVETASAVISGRLKGS